MAFRQKKITRTDWQTAKLYQKIRKMVLRSMSIQDSLQQEMQKIGEAIYAAQQATQSQSTQTNTKQNNDGVVDAEVVE